MGTVSTLLALCEENLLVTGGFPRQTPVMQSFDVFFDVSLNKWLSKQSRWWWFETPWHSLWRHCNVAPQGQYYHHNHINIYIYIKWTVFVNFTAKSAQHAHARMIAKTDLIHRQVMCPLRHGGSHFVKKYIYMGQVMELWLSCYLVLLSIESKTRQQDSHSSMAWPIYIYIIYIYYKDSIWATMPHHILSLSSSAHIQNINLIPLSRC